MKRTALTAIALAAFAASPALAERDHRPRGQDHARQSHQACPPGLAKKTPACIPPGQARKAQNGPRVGAPIGDGYIIIREYDRWGLTPPARGRDYYRHGDQIVLVDSETRDILALIGAVARVLN